MDNTRNSLPPLFGQGAIASPGVETCRHAAASLCGSGLRKEGVESRCSLCGSADIMYVHRAEADIAFARRSVRARP